jgi:cold-inducible RNA-binding protein
MGSKLYVGNLSYNVTSADLNTMFAAHGQVQSAEVIQDRESGRSKGFGFVQMGTDEEAQKAIAALTDQEHDGRKLTVNEAKPREERSGGSGGGYGGGGNRGGYSGGGRSSGGSSGGVSAGRSGSSTASRGYVERGNTGGRSATDADDRGNKRY